FTEATDIEKKEKRVQEIIAGGFYSYLKKHGYLKNNPEKQQKIQQTLEKSRTIWNNINSLDLA
ncbi:MAG: hypothetical protein V1739_06045, partial [Candidatus Omnitrophota bacterium]